MKALSIRQPWAWLILNEGKDVENRTWPTNLRGRVLIHASSTMTRRDYLDAVRFLTSDSRLAPALKRLPEFSEFSPAGVGALPAGGIVGEVEIVRCCIDSTSPWFVGPYGFVIQNPALLPFRKLKGMQKIFEVEAGL